MGVLNTRAASSFRHPQFPSTVPPDTAPCAACRSELRDRNARRHRYPFLSCGECGPRYSIALTLPFERERTTMRAFWRCSDCEREYADAGRRWHRAEAIACPQCGPTLSWRSANGTVLALGDEALRQAVASVRAGCIVALKGIGSYQLLCAAGRPEVVAKLRLRKRRPSQPFAVLFADERKVTAATRASEAELEALRSPAAPIVLVNKLEGALPAEVAPEDAWLGAMLPSSALHQLVADAVGTPLVCTAANLPEEPMCSDDAEAIARLGAMADGFLGHDRPIARPVADSVVRIEADGSLVFVRRARGYEPERASASAPRRSGTRLIAPQYELVL
jgi:hydrogenase maturation protein HypF